jgi:hypothetical protein
MQMPFYNATVARRSLDGRQGRSDEEAAGVMFLRPAVVEM